MKKTLALVSIIFLTSCSALYPSSKTISSQEDENVIELMFSDSPEKVVAAIKDAFNKEGWVISKITAVEGKRITSNISEAGYWRRSFYTDTKPDYLVYGRTPITPFSYGSRFYISVTAISPRNTAVTYVISTTQYFEKEKLADYLKTLATNLKSGELKNSLHQLKHIQAGDIQ